MPPPFRFIQALVWKVCVLFGGACPHCAMRRRHLALLRQDSGRSLAARPPLGSSPPNRSRAGRRGRRRVHTRGQRLSRGMVRTPRTPRWMSQMAWDFSASCGRRASSMSGPSEALWVWAWRVILPYPTASVRRLVAPCRPREDRDVLWVFSVSATPIRSTSFPRGTSTTNVRLSGTITTLFPQARVSERRSHHVAEGRLQHVRGQP